MEGIRRILAATDFGEDSRRAVAFAGTLAKQLGAKLVVVHVDEAQAVVPGSDLAKHEQASDMVAMSEVVRDLKDQGVDVTGCVVAGIPEREIVAMAEEQRCDLIVIGSRGGSAFMHVLFGSVAERVLHRASCPVLTVREPETTRAKVFDFPLGRAS